MMRPPFNIPTPSRKLVEWEAFEKRIQILFGQLMENDFAEKQIIGGYEVDCYSRDDLSNYIIECKTQQEIDQNCNSKLRDYITKFSGKKTSISNAINKLHSPGHTRDIVFIMCTKGIEVSAENRKLAEENHIYMWDENYILNLETLFKAIGPRIKQYARHELGIDQVINYDGEKTDYLRIPALYYDSKVSGKIQKQYNLFISAKHLLDLGYVFRISNGDPQSYQRVIKKNRLEDIAKYIDDKNTFNSSVVVALNDGSFFQPSGGSQESYEYKTGFLKIPKKNASIKIIDGQHRIYSYLWADPERLDDKLPVLAMTNLGASEQARIYIEINDHQKPVPKDELNLLMSKIDPFGTGFLPNIVIALNSKGILKNKIMIPDQKIRNSKLNLANVVKSLGDRKIFSDNLPLIPDRSELNDISQETVVKCSSIINDFLEKVVAIGDDVSSKWSSDFVFTNNGLSVFIYLLYLIAQYNEGKYNNRWLTLEIEQGIRNFFENNKSNIDLLRSSSSEAGRRTNAKLLVYEINLLDKSFGAKFIKDFNPAISSQELSKGDYLVIISDIENNLKKMITSRLSEKYPNWWLRCVSENTRRRVDVEMRKEEKSFIDVNRSDKEDFLTYGDMIYVIDNNWNIFQPILHSKIPSLNALGIIKDIRNKLSHGAGIEHLTPEEVVHFNSAIKSLTKRIDVKPS